MGAPFKSLDHRTTPPVKNRVFLTQHAIDQACNKFLHLKLLRDEIGREEFVRHLTACAGHAKDSGRETIILGGKFFVGLFNDCRHSVTSTLVFACAPDDVHPGGWCVRTILTLEQLDNNGNCRR